MKTNPLLIGAVAVGGLWFVGRARAQAAAVAGTRRTSNQDYSTPTAVAANFARAIVALTKNLATTPEVHAVATPAVQLDIAGLGPGTTLGGWKFGDTSDRGQLLGDPIFGWSAPNNSDVRNWSVAQFGSEVDQIPAGPLYNTTTDFVNNPFSFAAP